ncbi:unnamed protein product [Brachionus calyciflorus]|uniref:SWIM-type domain-containing protein n=1 Tax=Brachionus calyciflorus TaxID=104777 RepID=A0A814GXX2_9BILA|nr:unnamed protein product [Brachionus calyciflorus]
MTFRKQDIINENHHLDGFEIPQLNQIRNLINYYRKNNGNCNDVQSVESYIANYALESFDLDTMNENQFFIFGLKYKKNQKPIINCGTDDRHLNILTSFTLRIRLSVLNAIKCMIEKVVYYSERSCPINNNPKVCPKDLKDIIEFNFNDFKKVTEDIYQYTSLRDKEKLRVNIGAFTCDCSMFLDKAYCVHLIKLADLLDLDLDFFAIKKFFSLKEREL